MWISSVYANSSYAPTTDDISKSAIYLEDWPTTIHTWDFAQINFYKVNNTFLTDTIWGWSNGQLFVTCKNGYITSLSWYDGYSTSILLSPYTWQQEQVVLWVTGTNISGWKKITLKCNPIEDPVWIIDDMTDIDTNDDIVENVSAFSNAPTHFAISKMKIMTSSQPNISTDDVKKYFEPWSWINFQPSFTDIVFLQIKVIWNLNRTLRNTKTAYKFKNLFSTDDKFKNYRNWIKKFWKFTDKDGFIDAFSGSIWLKDIWIAQDIIAGQINCLKNNNCNHSIIIKHSITDNFKTYSLNELSNLFVWTDNIVSSIKSKQKIFVYNYTKAI